AVERGAEPPEFRLAADERARKTSDTARAHQRERPNEAPGGHDAGLPLRVDCFRPAELERAANRGDRSPARISPGSAACSRRAATFTASPLTNELPTRGRPTTTSPVLTPILSASPGSTFRCIESAAWRARSA